MAKFAHDKCITGAIDLEGTLHICTVCDGARRRMKWPGNRVDCIKRKNGKNKKDKCPVVMLV